MLKECIRNPSILLILRVKNKSIPCKTAYFTEVLLFSTLDMFFLLKED
jgi:hypothetical protein